MDCKQYSNCFFSLGWLFSKQCTSTYCNFLSTSSFFLKSIAKFQLPALTRCVAIVSALATICSDLMSQANAYSFFMRSLMMLGQFSEQSDCSASICKAFWSTPSLMVLIKNLSRSGGDSEASYFLRRSFVVKNYTFLFRNSIMLYYFLHSIAYNPFTHPEFAPIHKSSTLQYQIIKNIVGFISRKRSWYGFVDDGLFVVFVRNLSMQIKQYDKQGVVAWSNSKAHSELLASASIQEDQGGLYNLDILSLDLQERSKKINVIGNGYADSPFRCIAWDNFGEKQNTFSHGVIFTGMDNSSFKLWNPAQMIATYPTRSAPSLANLQSEEQGDCIIYEQQLENAFPVMCGEWNSLSNHMLAFGSTDVFILLVDKDPTNPDLRKPGKKNPHTGSYVTSVSWNRQVGHILASASENGLVALWDIKTNNSIFQFRDSGASTTGNRNVVICWSKNISTQIAVTLDDEKHNELQIWDLRNQKGPVVVIDKCHTKGINAMDWCETDPQLILTASRDKKVVCWNYSQEQVPLSQNTFSSQAVSVKWSKKLPSIYSVSTEENTFVCSLNDANLFSYVPKWYKVPVASTLCGSHAVLTYSEQRGNVLQENPLPDHNKKSPLRPKLKALTQVSLRKLDEEEGELATLIRAKTSSEGDSEIYDYLGFSKSKIVQEVEKYTGKKREFNTGHLKEKNPKHKPKAYTQIQGQDALAFFASINSQAFEQTPRTDEDEGAENYDMVPRNFNWDQGKEKLVKQNILIGNYEGAIDAALKCGRTAEALIIAYSVDQSLFSNTLKTFFTETTDSFITDVLKHIAYKDAEELVRKYDLNKWKECIALILTLAGPDKRPYLLGLLAHRLRTEAPEYGRQLKLTPIPENHPAIICYILAQNFAEITQLYFDNLRVLESGSLDRKLAAVEYARRLVMIIDHMTIEPKDVKTFQKIVREVAFIAIEERENTLAHHLFSTYAAANSTKIIDYLVTNTPDLETYKPSIKYKPIVLPVMQKKVEKKQQSQQQQQQQKVPDNKPQKPKAKIFEREEEVVKPPTLPPSKKRSEQPQDTGFSPYENAKQTEPAPKKNLNTPPPPPVSHKKPVHVQEDEEYEREAPPPPPQQPAKVQPPPVKKSPPPPPPSHQTHNYQPEDETAQRPNVIQKSTPVIPVATEKKTPPPPPAIHKQPPPPPPQVHRQQSSQVQQEQPRARPPPTGVRPNPPPPQRPVEPEVKEEPRKMPPPKLPPPPKVEERPKANLPPTKVEQPREEVYEQEAPVRRPPPPPPAKRNPPPPQRR